MKKLLSKTAACLVPFCVVLTACSSDGNTPIRMPRQLTIAEVPITRATLTEETIAGKTSLTPAWEEKDVATYFNLSAIGTDELLYGNLTASSSAENYAFKGTATCTYDDNLAFIYPAVEIKRDNGEIELEKDITLLYKRGDFIISLEGQKGTLDDIAKNFHYIYGVAKVKSLNADGSANATISNTKSLLSVCKFKFTDGTNPIPVKTLTIYYFGIGYIFNDCVSCPLAVPVTPSVNLDEVNAIPAYEEYEGFGDGNNLLTVSLNEEARAVNGDGVVYVALFPMKQAEYMQFTVTTEANKTYTAIYAVPRFQAGEYRSVTYALHK